MCCHVAAANDAPVVTSTAPLFSSRMLNLDQGYVAFTNSVRCIDFIIYLFTGHSNYSSPVYLVKGVTHRAVAHVKIVTFTSDGESIPITLTT